MLLALVATGELHTNFVLSRIQYNNIVLSTSKEIIVSHLLQTCTCGQCILILSSDIIIANVCVLWGGGQREGCPVLPRTVPDSPKDLHIHNTLSNHTLIFSPLFYNCRDSLWQYWTCMVKDYIPTVVNAIPSRKCIIPNVSIH